MGGPPRAHAPERFARDERGAHESHALGSEARASMHESTTQDRTCPTAHAAVPRQPSHSMCACLHSHMYGCLCVGMCVGGAPRVHPHKRPRRGRLVGSSMVVVATRLAPLCTRSRPASVMLSSARSAAVPTCPATLQTSAATATWRHCGGTPSETKPKHGRRGPRDCARARPGTGQPHSGASSPGLCTQGRRRAEGAPCDLPPSTC